MSDTPDQYLTQTAEGGWRITGTRVSIESVVHAFLEGTSPEEIVSQFPALSLEQAYGAITCYLKHRDEIDRYLAQHAEKWKQLKAAQARRRDPLLDRIRKARDSSGTPRKTA